jgi:hypothetical protein
MLRRSDTTIVFAAVVGLGSCVQPWFSMNSLNGSWQAVSSWYWH